MALIRSSNSSLAPSEATSRKIRMPPWASGVEHKGKIVKLEGLLIVIPLQEILPVPTIFGQKQEIVRDEGKEDHAAGLADPFCLGDTLQSILLPPQMVQRAEQQHPVEACLVIERKIQGIPLHQIDVIRRTKLGTESLQVALCKLQRRDPIPLACEI